MSKYHTRLAPILIKQEEVVKGWRKLIPPKKDVVLAIYVALMSLLSVIFVNHLTNKKEFNDHKGEFTDTYLKELNRRFRLLRRLSDNNNFVRKDSLKLNGYASRLEEANEDFEINYLYDSVKFNTYFNQNQFLAFKNIDSLITRASNDAIDNLKANDISYKHTLQTNIQDIEDRLTKSERQIYQSLAK